MCVLTWGALGSAALIGAFVGGLIVIAAQLICHVNMGE